MQKRTFENTVPGHYSGNNIYKRKGCAVMEGNTYYQLHPEDAF